MSDGVRIDLPRDEERRLRAEARLRHIRGRNDAAWQEHPWPFIRDAVFTVDPQADEKAGGIRKYPGEADEPQPNCPCTPNGCGSYREHLVNVWYMNKRLLIPKSRRLLVSWTMIACHYWLARYRPHSTIAFAARKQGQHKSEGSAELVDRAWKLHEHLPPTVTRCDVKESWCHLTFPNGSEILGIGEGADQARQYTFTAYLADEFAFWERAGETYAALLPTLEGGGRFTGVSSANPSFMQQLVHDEWNVGH